MTIKLTKQVAKSISQTLKTLDELEEKEKQERMAIRMGVAPDSIKAPEPLDEDVYTLRLDGFKPELSSKKTSINYNPQLKVISGDNTGAKNAGKPGYFQLNSAAGWIQNDFVHALGLTMEEFVDSNGNKQLAMPGEFNGDPEKPETWRYTGPMVGKTLKALVVKSTYNNKETSKIKKFFCAVADCNTRFPEVKHSEDLT